MNSKSIINLNVIFNLEYFLKDILKSTPILCTTDIKYILSSLLQQLVNHWESIHYFHGNISIQSIVAVRNSNYRSQRDIINQVFKQYDFLCNFYYSNFMSTKEFCQNKINLLTLGKK